MKNPSFFPYKTLWAILLLLFMAVHIKGICQANTPSAVLLSKGSTSNIPGNEVVIDLNKLTYTIAEQHDHFYSFLGIRTLSMVHLAIHDILNTSEPAYQRYYYRADTGNFDPVIAAAEATRVILTKTYPERMDTVNLVCNRYIEPGNSGQRGKAGVIIGKEAAEAYLLFRENDAHDKQGEYTPDPGPGRYQYTPGWDNWVLKPDFDYAKPFALNTISQFRSPAPPEINSREYSTAYEEVKAYGRKNSRLRSEQQTNYAHWWAEFGEHSWNRIGRITAKQRKLPLRETARMFALINMAIFDIYLASLESKYFYDTWRPYTAIRTDDSNPGTAKDPDWEPEMRTPPWPEYPSAHAAVGAGGAAIVSHIYGTPEVPFTMESVTALPNAKVRSYTNLYEAARECADSRVMNGYHFRFATDEGIRQGKLIANYIIDHYLKPMEIAQAALKSGGKND